MNQLRISNSTKRKDDNFLGNLNTFIVPEQRKEIDKYFKDDYKKFKKSIFLI